MNVAGAQDAEQKEQQAANAFGFDVEIFESRVWKDAYLKNEEQCDEIKELGTHQIFVTRITRTAGDAYTFHKIKSGFLLQKCSSILKGLPKWALKMEEAAEEEVAKDEAENKEAEAEDEDEYDKLMQAEYNSKEALLVTAQ